MRPWPRSWSVRPSRRAEARGRHCRGGRVSRAIRKSSARIRPAAGRGRWPVRRRNSSRPSPRLRSGYWTWRRCARSIDLQRARLARLRAEISFALRRGRDAPPLLLKAAARLAALDPAAARRNLCRGGRGGNVCESPLCRFGRSERRRDGARPRHRHRSHPDRSTSSSTGWRRGSRSDPASAHRLCVARFRPSGTRRSTGTKRQCAGSCCIRSSSP